MDWKVITIGHLSRNKFWGESEDKPHRETCATCSLIKTGTKNIIVDPSLPEEQIDEVLFNSSGLHASDIDIVYSTHFHGDHTMGLNAFTNAKCVMAKKDFYLAKERGDLSPLVLSKMTAAEEPLSEGISYVELPGHTEGTTGLMFDAPEGRVLITGDAVMSYEFFKANEGYYYNKDLEKSKETILWMKENADIVVPGHGNYFLVKSYL